MVTLTPASTQTVTVDFATADDTATAGDDYTRRWRRGALRTSTVETHLHGRTNHQHRLGVDGGGRRAGGDRSLHGDAEQPDGGHAGGRQPSRYAGTITDDDDEGGGGVTTPELWIGDAAVEEGGTAEFEVTLSPAGSETVTVDFQTVDGTAAAGSDYTTKTGTLTFAAGQTTKTIMVSTVEDDVQEETEAFTVTLSNPTGATLADDSGTGTITDDDDEGGGGVTTPELWIGDAAVEEGGTAEFEVTLSPAGSETVTVDFQTVDGTAAAGSDYTTKTGTLTFAAGQTTKTIMVSTVEDDVQEETEAFTVTLSNPTGATLADDSGTGTITDDDDEGGGGVTTPELSIGDAAVEEGGTAEFEVTLSPAGSETVTVDFQTVDGTAAAGSDYTTKTGTLTFAAGANDEDDHGVDGGGRRAGGDRSLHGDAEQPDGGHAGGRQRYGDHHRRRRGRRRRHHP